MDEVMERRRAAMCRGCEAILTEMPGAGTWMGIDGVIVCIPTLFGRMPVLHMPLPEGFRGAPQ